jgi:hypothetical protein
MGLSCGVCDEVCECGESELKKEGFTITCNKCGSTCTVALYHEIVCRDCGNREDI